MTEQLPLPPTPPRYAVTPFQAMQSAVDIVGTSPHPSNKVAASVLGEHFVLSRTNHWPERITDKIGIDTRIGSSSGTIHAETACLFAAAHDGMATQGCALLVTDPPCPNCAKNMAEAGIRAVYIDHKGFDKDFFQRRSNHFDSLSMQIFEQAGIAVYEIRRKEEKITPIWLPAFPPTQGFVEPDEKRVTPLNGARLPSEEDFRAFISTITKNSFCAALACDRRGHIFGITAEGYRLSGIEPVASAPCCANTKDEKYTPIVEPLTHLLMALCRKGLRPLQHFVFANALPSSRGLVNLVGAGIHTLSLPREEESQSAKDPATQKAVQQLTHANVLDIRNL